MRKVYLFCLLFLTALTYAPSIIACSGGAPFFIQDLDNRDIIVHATVLDVDERGYNAILQVNRYFKGQAGEYVTVIRYSPALETTASIRDYDTSCTYSGGGQAWITGSSGYFALTTNGNGTFDDRESWGSGVPHFFVQDGMIEFYDHDKQQDSFWELQSLPVIEFELLLLEYGGLEVPVEPEPNEYPLMRFLHITTQSGQQYRLNPDRSLTQLDHETYPMAISNDGSHVMFHIDDEQLGFQYLSLIAKPFFEDRVMDGGWLIPQNGQWGIFSPDSNFVAVQQSSQLAVYMFDNYQSGGYGQRMNMQLVATAEVVWLEYVDTPIVWSADSTTIAYQDEQGIWHWDIFESSEPQLILPSHDAMTLLDISESGRYVRYGNAETWFLLDVLSGEVFERAIATPDESNLIFIQPEFPEDTLDINRRGGRECYVPLAERCPIYINWAVPFEFFWYKDNQIAIYSCSEDLCYVFSTNWQLAIGISDIDGRLDVPFPFSTAVAYDITYDETVVAVEGYELEFDFNSNSVRSEPSDRTPDIDFIDLREQLDSPIVHLEWGQPIFYEHSHNSNW